MADDATIESSISRHAFNYQPPAINGDFLGKHIISVDQFQRRDLDILFDAASSIRAHPHERSGLDRALRRQGYGIAIL